MKIMIKGKRVYQCSWKRILYMVCFCFFCIIDQRIMTCNSNSGERELFRDLMGVGMAVLILSHYSWREFFKHKLPYLIWTAAALVCLPIAYWKGLPQQSFPADWLVIMIDIWIWGYVLICTGINVFLAGKLPRLRRGFAAVWFLMMLLMVVSRSELLWPLCYLTMFGTFYLTGYDTAEREDLFQGALNGIIAAFFLFQGHCFLFRPYDRVRYAGWYSNSNNNALFYLIVLAAVLTKLYFVIYENKNKWCRLYYLLGAGTVLSFIFMTIGRAAWITAVVMVAVFLIFLCGAEKKKHFIRNGLILVLCVCLTFPLCFAAARYIPPLRHHPVWWFTDEYSESRVHSWDPWDSEKYVEIDDLFEESMGRVVQSVQELLEHVFPALKVNAAEIEKVSVLTLEEGEDSYLVRASIYKHFWNELNWLGHKQNEIGVQMTPGYWVGHAHNIFLQFGTDFGIPVMILFFGILLWSLGICFMRWKKEKDKRWAGGFLWLLIPLIFGMFEYAWGAGSLMLLMVFCSWRQVICEKDDGG